VDVLGETAFVVLVVGLFVSFQGLHRAFVAWFALFYLFFIIPIPPSITTQITFKLKTIAAQVSVDVLSALGLPLIREGSYIHWSTDRLLVGDVCGGLKSLIALIAFGTFMAYISKTRLWARWVLFVLAGPIAIVVNVLRIMFLAVVGYYYGSDVAGGKVHDVSGIAIFVAAFAVYLALEGALRKYAPAREDSAEDPEATGTEGT
jgi:exosortase